LTYKIEDKNKEHRK